VGVLRSVLGWYVWGESSFSRHEDVFTFNLPEKYVFYKLCTVEAIRKYNAAVNCITVQHKKKVCSPHFFTDYTIGHFLNDRLDKSLETLNKKFLEIFFLVNLRGYSLLLVYNVFM
jgi:hypothetical protein